LKVNLSKTLEAQLEQILREERAALETGKPRGHGRVQSLGRGAR
jgi:hypothetical protein